MFARWSPNIQGAIYMVLAMFGFTVNDLFVKIIGLSLPLFEIIAVRGLFICFFLALWWLFMRAKHRNPAPPSLHHWPKILFRALMEVLATIAFLMGLVRIPFADVSAVMQSLPLAVTAGAVVFLGEVVGWRRWAAILVGFVGVLIIIRPGTLSFDPAILLIVLSVVFAAARDLVTRTLPKQVDSYWVTVATAVMVVVFAVVATSTTAQWQVVTLKQYALMLSAAAFLIVGYQCIIKAMRVGEVASVTPFRYSSLLWAVAFGYFLFGEVPDTYTVLGSVLVVGTGLFAWYRERSVAN